MEDNIDLQIYDGTGYDHSYMFGKKGEVDAVENKAHTAIAAAYDVPGPTVSVSFLEEPSYDFEVSNNWMFIAIESVLLNAPLFIYNQRFTEVFQSGKGVSYNTKAEGTEEAETFLNDNKTLVKDIDLSNMEDTELAAIMDIMSNAKEVEEKTGNPNKQLMGANTKMIAILTALTMEKCIHSNQKDALEILFRSYNIRNLNGSPIIIRPLNEGSEKVMIPNLKNMGYFSTEKKNFKETCQAITTDRPGEVLLVTATGGAKMEGSETQSCVTSVLFLLFLIPYFRKLYRSLYEARNFELKEENDVKFLEMASVFGTYVQQQTGDPRFLNEVPSVSGFDSKDWFENIWDNVPRFAYIPQIYSMQKLRVDGKLPELQKSISRMKIVPSIMSKVENKLDQLEIAQNKNKTIQQNTAMYRKDKQKVKKIVTQHDNRNMTNMQNMINDDQLNMDQGYERMTTSKKSAEEQWRRKEAEDTKELIDQGRKNKADRRELAKLLSAKREMSPEEIARRRKDRLKKDQSYKNRPNYQEPIETRHSHNCPKCKKHYNHSHAGGKNKHNVRDRQCPHCQDYDTKQLTLSMKGAGGSQNKDKY